MKISEFLKRLGIDTEEEIVDDKPKQVEPKQVEQKVEPKVEQKQDERDLLIETLKQEVARYKETIVSKDEIINQNNEQISALKELGTINSPINEQEPTLQELIERGEF